MKYLVIAYDERQTPFEDLEPLDLYAYLRNEFDNQGIVAGMVECASFAEIETETRWLDNLYTDFMKEAQA